MTIIEIDPCNDPRWEQFASSHRFGSVFLAPAWLQVIKDTYGFDVKALLAMDDNEQIIAGMPYCRLNDMLGQRFIVFPFCDYCDPLAVTKSEWMQLTSQINLAQVTKIRSLYNKIPVEDDRFDLLWKAKWHGLEISADLEELIVNIDGSARRGITKSIREGVKVSAVTSVADLRKFYNLHLQIRKVKYRLLAQPFPFFENIWHLIIRPGGGTILKAEYQGEMIGAAMFLNWGNTTYYKISASDTSYKSLRISEVLIWEGIKYAKTQGASFFDLGLSDWEQEGLVAFKRKFASKEKPIYQLVSKDSRDTTSLRQNLIRSLLPRLTDFLTTGVMPDGVTEKAGNVLYRYFA